MKYFWNACITIYMKKRENSFVLIILHFTFINSFYCVFPCTCRKYFKIWNTLPLQGPSYPDLSSPVALAELAPLTESQNGAQDVVADKNEGDEEGKIEVVMLEKLS